MALPNPTMSFSPFAILTAEEMNNLVENDQALAAGTGFNTGAIPTAALADGSVTAAKTSGIWWEEIGRTTLSANSTSISVPSFAGRKWLRVMVRAINSGTLASIIRFNNDSGTNYAYRISANGTADSTSTSNNAIIFESGAYNLTGYYDITNFTTYEKSIYGLATAENTIGAGNVPGRTSISAKWSNTSTQITRVDIITSTGNFAAGSEVVVLGHN